MTRKFLVAGNWKMNTTLKEGIELYGQINDLALESNWEMPNSGSLQIVICPPFTHVYPLLELPTKNLTIGVQNCASESKGAFTGEVSASMVASLNIHYVILGHSERRLYFHENEEILTKKVDLALSSSLIPVFCIGETQSERESGGYLKIIEDQIEKSLFHLSPEQFSQLILAYEPVWAIGTGLTASPEQAQEVHSHIRTFISTKFGSEIGEALTILYGGSCNEKNSDALFSQKDIDGGLIGGASLKPREFIQIAKSLFNHKSHS